MTLVGQDDVVYCKDSRKLLIVYGFSHPHETSDRGVELKPLLRRRRDFPGGPVVKNLPYKAGDVGLIPGPGTRSHMWQNN